MKFAHILNGTVVNISVWDHAPTEVERSVLAPVELVDLAGRVCGLGWAYDGTNFVQPLAQVATLEYDPLSDQNVVG